MREQLLLWLMPVKVQYNSLFKKIDNGQQTTVKEVIFSRLLSGNKNTNHIKQKEL